MLEYGFGDGLRGPEYASAEIGESLNELREAVLEVLPESNRARQAKILRPVVPFKNGKELMIDSRVALLLSKQIISLVAPKAPKTGSPDFLSDKSEDAELSRAGGIQHLTGQVSPYFGPPKSPTDTPEVFVLMSFAASLKPVYEDHVRKVVQNLSLTVGRADDFFSARDVIQDIWGAINAARLIIADCTGRNPNVFYEIGIAHTLGKPVILTTQCSDDVPFDLRQIRYLLYELTPRGMIDFEDRLKKAVLVSARGVLSPL